MQWGGGHSGPSSPSSVPASLAPHTSCVLITTPRPEKPGAIRWGSLILSPQTPIHTPPSASSPAASGEGSFFSEANPFWPWALPPLACSRTLCYGSSLGQPIPGQGLEISSHTPALRSVVAELQMDPCPLRLDLCPTFWVRCLTARPPGPVAASLSSSCFILLLLFFPTSSGEVSPATY